MSQFLKEILRVKDVRFFKTGGGMGGWGGGFGTVRIFGDNWVIAQASYEASRGSFKLCKGRQG